MSWDIIQSILQWLIPVGGFGSVVGWFINLTERELKRIRDSHDAYKTMYEDLSETVKEDINEKKKLRTMVGRLERALSKIYGCRHYPNCPVNVELRRGQADSTEPKQRGKGQSRNKGNTGGDSRDSAGVESAADDSNGEPP